MGKYYADGNRETGGIDLTPDGKRVVQVYRGPSIEVGGRVIEVETGKEVCTLCAATHAPLRRVVRFSAMAPRVAQVANGVARIWNAETGADAVPLPGHRGGGATSIVPAADGRVAFSAGSDLTVRCAWGSRTRARESAANGVPPVRRLAPYAEGVVVQESPFGATGPACSLMRRPASPGRCRASWRRPRPGRRYPRSGSPSPTPSWPCPRTVIPWSRSHVTRRRFASGRGRGQVDGGGAVAPPEKLKLARCLAAHFTPDGRQLIAVRTTQAVRATCSRGR